MIKGQLNHHTLSGYPFIYLCNPSAYIPCFSTK